MDLFFDLGSIALVFYILDKIYTFSYLVYWKIQDRRHEQYCEECEDEIWAETFRSMRGKDDQRGKKRN